MEIQYKFEKEVSYSSTREYRQCMRELFSMNSVKITDDIDEETKDEMDYDDSTMSLAMSKLFDYTKDTTCFQELYDLAAALMISVDREIGQAVLLSYDYLSLFHSCLASFHREPFGFNDQNPCFLELKKKLSK